jgi:hypothetical protein
MASIFAIELATEPPSQPSGGAVDRRKQAGDSRVAKFISFLPSTSA